MSDLSEWLSSRGINSPKVLDTLTTLGGVTTPEELLLLEDDDFKELASEGGFTLLEKRKLINAVKQMRQDANPPPAAAAVVVAPDADDDEKKMPAATVVPQQPEQLQPGAATESVTPGGAPGPLVVQQQQQQQEAPPSQALGALGPLMMLGGGGPPGGGLSLEQLLALARVAGGDDDDEDDDDDDGPSLPNSNSTGIEGRLDCANCNGNFPQQEGEVFEGTWYCGRCVKEVSAAGGSGGGNGQSGTDAEANGSGGGGAREGLSPELRLLAALLGAASDMGGGAPSGSAATGAGRVDSDTFRVTRDNIINVFQALNIEITRTFTPQLFQFENTFGKVFCRVDNNELSKCIIQTYAYFQSDISKRIDKIKFAMQWNLKHAFTKLNVDKDEDFCMESDFVFPQPASGLLPTRGDMKELILFWNDIWQQSIVTFHLEARQFSAQLRGM